MRDVVDHPQNQPPPDPQKMPDFLTFVHLSDIHFTGQSGESCYDLDVDVRNELERDAKDLVGRLGQATGVLVTGDVAFSGGRAEYAKAGDWLAKFCAGIKCPGESVWTVPGNHDVHRDTVKKSKITRDAHERIRARPVNQLDEELREYCGDPAAARALFEPLAEYNRFADRYQCEIAPAKPFWERELRLRCGTLVRLRGLSSVLVSDIEDERGNLVLGTAQVGTGSRTTRRRCLGGETGTNVSVWRRHSSGECCSPNPRLPTCSELCGARPRFATLSLGSDRILKGEPSSSRRARLAV
jgi:Calcineurin-like phosphoesterase